MHLLEEKFLSLHLTSEEGRENRTWVYFNGFFPHVMVEVSVTDNGLHFLANKKCLFLNTEWSGTHEVCSLPSHSMAMLFCSYPIHFVSSVPFLFFSPFISVLLFKNSFIALHSSLKGSLLQNHFKIHYTYLLLLLVILSHFLSLQFWRDLVSLRWVSLWLKSI